MSRNASLAWQLCPALTWQKAHDILNTVSTISASRASLAEQAYLSIRERILRGQLALGSVRLRRRLAEELGMSMLPITEAVQRLEAEGLLRKSSAVGTRERFRANRTFGTLHHPGGIGMPVGAHVCGEGHHGAATGAASDGGKSGCSFQPEPDDGYDPEFLFAVHRYHFQFHMKITEHSGCSALREMIEREQRPGSELVVRTFRSSATPPPRFHRDLATILNTGEPLAADAAMRQHVRWGIDETGQAIRRTKLPVSPKWRLRGIPLPP